MQALIFEELPWVASIWQQLLPEGRASLARLPHALLLRGREGLGKRRFGQALADLLICESPIHTAEGRAHACGHCPGCRWLAGGNHPDFRLLSPADEEDEDSGEGGRKEKKRGAGQIKIDAVRELEDFVFVGSHRHGKRVALIADAEALNLAAANALLKILEEPPPSVYFILISSHSQRLLPTIRSRCRQVSFKRPEGAVAAHWIRTQGLPEGIQKYLDLAGGAPLKLAQWKESGQLEGLIALVESLQHPPPEPLALAQQWDGLLKRHSAFSMEMLVEGVQRWLLDVCLCCQEASPRYHGAWPPPKLAAEQAERLHGGWRELLRFRRSARHPLNQLLVLEDLATQTLRAMHSGSQRGA